MKSSKQFIWRDLGHGYSVKVLPEFTLITVPYSCMFYRASYESNLMPTLPDGCRWCYAGAKEEDSWAFGFESNLKMLEKLDIAKQMVEKLRGIA